MSAKADSTNTYPFLQGGGEMGELIRRYDWSGSVLNTPDLWPQSLRTTLGIVLHSAFPMFLFWGKELICFYNDAYRPSLGIDGKHPALGKSGPDVWPEIWHFIGPLIDQVMQTGEPTWFEDWLLPIFRNGRMEDVYWTFSYSPTYGNDGQIAGVFVTCTETTQAVHAIHKLKESEQRFQNLVRDASVGIIVVRGEDMTVELVNNAYARLIDRRCDELNGKPLFAVVPEAEEAFRPILDQVRKTGKPVYRYSYPYFVLVNGVKKEGFLDLAYQPYKEQAGNITGVMVLCQDVTEQVADRRKLLVSEQRFRSLIEEAPVATCLLVGREMRIEIVNEVMLGYWGKDATVLGRPLTEAVPELNGQPIRAILDEVFDSGKTHEAKSVPAVQNGNGRTAAAYFDYTFKPLRNPAGEVYAVINMAVDVTRQVMSRQQLEEAESSLRGAVELAELGTWSLDVASQTLTYSDRLKSWFGFQDEETVYSTGYIPVREEDRERVKSGILSALTPECGGTCKVEFTVVDYRTGRKRIIQALGKMMFDESGKPIRLSGTAQDITAQKNTQFGLEDQVAERTEELAATNEELVSANEELATTNEELAAANGELSESNQLLIRSNQNLQQFAYVASHDLQEPLRKVKQFSDLLHAQYADQLGQGVDYLQRMQVAADRMSILIKDLLTFSRISTRQDRTEPVSLLEVVQTALSDLELLIQETGAVVELAPLPTVPGDPSQLGQLFQNLLTNALKFRRPGVNPVIRVNASRVTAAALPGSVKTARVAKVYHRIDVADNGIGFDEKYLDRIFQVFQRLHGRSEFAGTGIGLAICEKVAANHGGAITASSRLGEGSTFSVFLPA